MELYKEYRPKDFDEVIGQDEAVKILRSYVKNKNIPHALLLAGSTSGSGKTTLARILASYLPCEENLDLFEINCGTVDKPLQMVKDIDDQMTMSTLSGGCRIWILDEFQALMRSKASIEAFLKVFEDMPNHAYFFICTTEAQKLPKTIQTRFAPIHLKPIAVDDLVDIVRRIAKKENKPISEALGERIANVSNGSARRAVQVLEQVINVEDELEAEEIVTSSDTEKKSENLYQLLMNKKTRWADVAKALTDVGNDDAEGLRRSIIGYAASCLLKSNPTNSYDKWKAARAYMLIQSCRDNLYDCGRAGLIAACFEVFHAKELGG